MRRFLPTIAAILLCAGWFCLGGTNLPHFKTERALAQVPMTGAGLGKPASGGSGCSQATTFLARTSGLSGTETTAYTDMICGMVTDGTWSGLDVLYFFATNNTTTAALNLVSTSYGCTITGGGTTIFYTDTGWAFNTGGNASCDTGLPVNTGGIQYQQNSASVGVYVYSSPSNFIFETGWGNTAETCDAQILPNYSATSLTYAINDTSFPLPTFTPVAGIYIASRTTSTLSAIYVNGSLTPVTTDSTTSCAPLDFDFYVGSRNKNNAVDSAGDDTISAWFQGTGLSAADASAIASRINGAMTTLGKNVY